MLGICGGYQMLADEIDDPVESRLGRVGGLGLLPVRVTFGPAKRLGRPAGRALGAPVTGYEIHHGIAEVTDPAAEPFLDGCRRGAVWGTSWHGVLENDEFRRAFLAEVAALAGRDFTPGARHRFRRGTAGAAGRPRRPGGRSPGHRRAEPADHRRAAARDAVSAGLARPWSIGFAPCPTRSCTPRRPSPPATAATATSCPRTIASISTSRCRPSWAAPAVHGTNPEQLFAAGYAACFHSALRGLARQAGVDASHSTVTAQVGVGPDGDMYGLVVTLVISIPSLDQARTRELAEAAHQRCPYSRATRGNISVELRVP